jgi:hypothetical protein
MFAGIPWIWYFKNVGIDWRHQLIELEVNALLYLTSIISYNQYFISVASQKWNLLFKKNTQKNKKQSKNIRISLLKFNILKKKIKLL